MHVYQIDLRIRHLDGCHFELRGGLCVGRLFNQCDHADTDTGDGPLGRYTKVDMPVAFAEIGDLITRDPSLRGGRPIIARTGVSVRTITIESNRGLSADEIAADRPPFSLAQIYAALAFYHANKQEIDSNIAAEEKA